jgi:hypothetical protein
MRGLAQTELNDSLYKVRHDARTRPATEIENLEERVIPCIYASTSRFRPGDDIIEGCRDVKLTFFTDFAGFSFDELCKMYLSLNGSMDWTVSDLFEKKANNYHVVAKIQSTVWYREQNRNDWNAVVDAYNGIRAFTLDLGPDFEVRLDYTTGHHEASWSELTRTFIDGVFAFLIYYQGAHVMTVSFTFMEDHTLLVRQVQLKEPRGNRFLYRFKGPYLPYLLTRLKAAFVHHSLYLVCGRELVASIDENYTNALARAERSNDKNPEHITKLTTQLAHLRADSDRIARFYREVTPFILGSSAKHFHGLHHHVVF